MLRVIKIDLSLHGMCKIRSLGCSGLKKSVRLRCDKQAYGKQAHSNDPHDA